ncbi:hypothetical protein KL932_004087 [Ogataea haglerorum]|nr:hypothetical protein KL932_004087 [Ogataea haglerorum]
MTQRPNAMHRYSGSFSLSGFLEDGSEVAREQRHEHRQAGERGGDQQVLRRGQLRDLVAVVDLEQVAHDRAHHVQLERVRGEHVEAETEPRDVDDPVVRGEIVEHVSLGLGPEREVARDAHDAAHDAGERARDVGHAVEAVERGLSDRVVDERGVVVAHERKRDHADALENARLEEPARPRHLAPNVRRHGRPAEHHDQQDHRHADERNAAGLGEPADVLRQRQRERDAHDAQHDQRVPGEQEVRHLGPLHLARKHRPENVRDGVADDHGKPDVAAKPKQTLSQQDRGLAHVAERMAHKAGVRLRSGQLGVDDDHAERPVVDDGKQHQQHQPRQQPSVAERPRYAHDACSEDRIGHVEKGRLQVAFAVLCHEMLQRGVLLASLVLK